MGHERRMVGEHVEIVGRQEVDPAALAQHLVLLEVLAAARIERHAQGLRLDDALGDVVREIRRALPRADQVVRQRRKVLRQHRQDLPQSRGRFLVLLQLLLLHAAV